MSGFVTADDDGKVAPNVMDRAGMEVENGREGSALGADVEK